MQFLSLGTLNPEEFGQAIYIQKIADVLAYPGQSQLDSLIFRRNQNLKEGGEPGSIDETDIGEINRELSTPSPGTKYERGLSEIR